MEKECVLYVCVSVWRHAILSLPVPACSGEVSFSISSLSLSLPVESETEYNILSSAA